MSQSNVLPFEPPLAAARHPRAGFENIPRDLSKAELLRYSTYSPEDRHEIFQCRGDSNKVGFALLLGGVRLTGRFPAGFELIGSTLLAHVCAQLSLNRMENRLLMMTFGMYHLFCGITSGSTGNTTLISADLKRRRLQKALPTERLIR